MSLPDHLLALIQERQASVDKLDPEQRAVVHEYGWGIVSGFLQVGIKKPKQMRHLIRLIQHGGSETQEWNPATRRLSFAAKRLQDALSDIGITSVSPRALAAAIRIRGGVLMPMGPPDYMVEASMNALDRRNTGFVNKKDKHFIRLDDALKAAVVVEMSEPET